MAMFGGSGENACGNSGAEIRQSDPMTKKSSRLVDEVTVS